MSDANRAPVVRSFHHADSGTWSHVVVDPATRHAAIVDPVLDFDVASGLHPHRRARNAFSNTSARPACASTGSSKRTRMRITCRAGAWLRERTRREARRWRGHRRCAEDVQAPARSRRRFSDRRLAVRSAVRRRRDVRDRRRSTCARSRRRATRATASAISRATRCSSATRCSRRTRARRAAIFRAATRRRCIARSCGSTALPEATRVFLCHDYPAADAAPVAEVRARDAEATAMSHVRDATDAKPTLSRCACKRDAKLAIPKLLWPALQFNLRGGRLPSAADGARYVKFRSLAGRRMRVVEPSDARRRQLCRISRASTCCAGSAVLARRAASRASSFRC